MKVFRNNKIYVQKNDIMFAFNHSNSIPSVIINQFFKGIVIVDDNNRMDFVSFEDKAAIDYFSKLDYIINYDDYKNLTVEELDEKLKVLIETIDTIATKHNNLSREKRAKNYSLVKDECEKLEYVINYLDEIIKIKLGTNHMDIPGEIVDADFSEIEPVREIEDSNNKGIKRFIREKIFKK